MSQTNQIFAHGTPAVQENLNPEIQIPRVSVYILKERLSYIVGNASAINNFRLSAAFLSPLAGHGRFCRPWPPFACHCPFPWLWLCFRGSFPFLLWPWLLALVMAPFIGHWRWPLSSVMIPCRWLRTFFHIMLFSACEFHWRSLDFLIHTLHRDLTSLSLKISVVLICASPVVTFDGPYCIDHPATQAFEFCVVSNLAPLY